MKKTILSIAGMLFKISLLAQSLPSFNYKAPYSVPEQKKIRVIISSDAACEVDDPFAIVQAVLTPQFIIKGIIAAHFNNRVPASMEKSYCKIMELLKVMKLSNQIAVLKGADHPLTDEYKPITSEGTDLIIKEALTDNRLPLYVLCFGPLTDVASAILEKPEIASRLTIIWSGGGTYPEGSGEFNLSNDINAANWFLKVKLTFGKCRPMFIVRLGSAPLPYILN